MVQSPFVRIDFPASCLVCKHEAMATQWEFWLSGHDPDYLRQAAQEAFARIDELEDKLSLYRESSDVTRLNLAPPGTELRVSDEARDCLLLSLRMSSLTQGAFHAFLGFNAITAKSQSLPLHLQGLPLRTDLNEADPILSISEDGNIIRKLREGALLDLGALGKGFALDLAAASLEEWDVTQACLMAGGSSVLALDPPKGTATYVASIPGRLEPLGFSHIALGASGLGYQQAHIVNPLSKTLQPRHKRAYAAAPSAAEADALSTAAMNLSCEALQQLSTAQPQYSFLICPQSSTQSESYVSSGGFFTGTVPQE